MILKRFIHILHIGLITLLLASCTTPPKVSPTVELPQQGINAQNIGILVKNNDELSLRTALLYKQARNIPEAHIFYLDLPNQANISPKQFKALYQTLTAQVGDDIQAFVATWQSPYRVGCMSITSALAFGYDQKWCQPKKKGCFPTANSPYFNSNSDRPWQDLKMRPTMLLTGKNYQTIHELVQRGVQSDSTHPKAHAYLIQTSDKARSTRGYLFKRFAKRAKNHPQLQVHFLNAQAKHIPDFIANKQNIMFYQTGLKQVPEIKSNHYLPGAIADHLTSAGGKGLSEQGQMKAFRWLEAGATGSYGTVVEPCNFVQKFPNPELLIPRYLQGETLIEAYWKSVLQPSEGLFIGEPLAKPYKPSDIFTLSQKKETLRITTNRLNLKKSYQLLAWQEKSQTFTPIFATFNIMPQNRTLTIYAPNANATRYKVVEVMPQTHPRQNH